jgi:predicted phosphoadenosine phosphosulfate sulfurtransferase
MNNEGGRVYLKETVLQAARKRIEWLFDEFPNLIVCYSGGKDSTATLQLTLEVAEEKGRLPVKTLFVDQEAEWQTVIDHIREVQKDPRVDMDWLQIPIKLFNATSTDEDWLQCWEPGQNWMREKEPEARTENIYGTDRFAALFGAYLKTHYANEKAVMISGVRCEESPGRLVGLTSFVTYKGETWGKKRDVARGHYDMYPLYDWSYTDIWKAIHDHQWPYCKIYDYQYQHGVNLQDMRVSNLHHETSIASLYYLQEIEQDTWNKLTERISGISTAGQMKSEAFQVKELPFMFDGWKEYRDFLLDKLITDPDNHELFAKKFRENDRDFDGISPRHEKRMYKVHIGAMLANDYHMTKIKNAMTSGVFMAYRRWKQGKRVPQRILDQMMK